MSNLFPAQTVAPLCASKSYALYRETESNVYTLYINDVMETDDLMDLRHALNDIKSLSLRHPYDYTIKLYINATAGTYAASKILSSSSSIDPIVAKLSPINLHLRY